MQIGDNNHNFGLIWKILENSIRSCQATSLLLSTEEISDIFSKAPI